MKTFKSYIENRIDEHNKIVFSNYELHENEESEFTAEQKKDMVDRWQFYYNKLVGKKVFVHKNLTLTEKMGKIWYSIKNTENKNLVEAYAPEVMINEADFDVSAASNETVRKSRQKNVHAGVVGILSNEPYKKLETSIDYYPFSYKDFVRLSDDKGNLLEQPIPVMSAKQVALGNKPYAVTATGVIDGSFNSADKGMMTAAMRKKGYYY